VDGGRPDVAEAMARGFLGKLPLELVDELLAEGDRTSYPAGTTIYGEGDAPRAVLVIDGLLRVYMTSAEGRQVTVRYARDADVLGSRSWLVARSTSPSKRLRRPVCSESTPGPSRRQHGRMLGWRGRWPRS
jgi:CRP-like cAMP-binding protein